MLILFLIFSYIMDLLENAVILLSLDCLKLLVLPPIDYYIALGTRDAGKISVYP